jgi:polyhydroxybutyrate depolymerase
VKALLAVLILASSASAETLTLDVDGRRRRALIREPKAGSAPRPLVLLLHGGGGNPEHADDAYGMTELAAKEGFLVAYPAGTGRFKRFLTWNAGNCCGYAMEKGVDDVKFLAALVGKLVQDGRADPERVFITGMSNGAMMSHRFACERADLVAGVAAVGGTMAVEACAPSRPVSVLMIHGGADEHVPLAGGTGKKAQEPRVDRSFPDTAVIWAEANRCKLARVTDGVYDRAEYECPGGAGMTTYQHAGGHIWPGSKQPRYRGADPMLSEPKATPLIWEFFKKHPRR